MPTWKRLAATKEALANSLAEARRHELGMIHQELEHIDEWLDQQRSQLDALLFGGQPISRQPSEAEAEAEGELQQSRERLEHDDMAYAAVEEGIESILEHIRAQIHNLTHHKARSTVRPPRRFALTLSLSLWRLTMVANRVQAWFKLEERGLKQMDDVVDRLKQTFIDVRTQTWIIRMVRRSPAAHPQRER